MKRCLKSIVSTHFIEENELCIITGWDLDTFRNLLSRFDAVMFEERSLTQDDFEVIFQAVLQLSGFPTAHPRDLEPFLDVSRLHLKWFMYRLRPIRNEWNQHVHDDSTQPRCASILP